MKLSGREDGNKCLKNNTFTFVTCYGFASSCNGHMSTGCTDILSKIKYHQKSYDCSIRVGRTREVSYLLDLAGGQVKEKPVKRRAVKGREQKGGAAA